MKVQTISNNQNFEGKIVIQNKLPKTAKDAVNRFVEDYQEKVLFAPFDLFIRKSKAGRVAMSPDKNFKKSYVVKTDTRYSGYKKTYEEIQNDAAQKIKQSSLKDKILYFLGFKKYTGK